MLTLIDIAGLPLGLDEEVENLVFDQEEVRCEYSNQVGLDEIIHALLNKSLRYPETVYSHHCQIRRHCDCSDWNDAIKYDVLMIPAGLLGIEYVKTHIFHINAAFAKIACVIHVFQGELTIVMQKNKELNDPFEINTVVEEAKIVVVGSDDKVVIPAGYYYTFINAGDMTVVFARVVMQEHIVNYQTLQRQNGMAYYLISKNARPELVSNPRYRDIVEAKQIDKAELNERYEFKNDSKVPLYEEVIGNFSLFANLLGVA